MTVASVWKNETVKRIMVEGHSGYAELGYDIVCSSVSTAMIYSANLVSKLSENCNIVYNEKKVIIDITINENDPNVKSILDKVMETLHETLEDINSQYPKYFKIKYFG